MQLYSIASGSSGNCIYVGHASTHLLIDAGISGKRIEQGLAEIGVEPENLSGILITHEHSDHIQGIGVLARKYKIPLYGTVETFCAVKKGKTSVGKIEDYLQYRNSIRSYGEKNEQSDTEHNRYSNKRDKNQGK